MDEFSQHWGYRRSSGGGGECQLTIAECRLLIAGTRKVGGRSMENDKKPIVIRFRADEALVNDKLEDVDRPPR